jgi:hypothetical protein
LYAKYPIGQYLTHKLFCGRDKEPSGHEFTQVRVLFYPNVEPGHLETQVCVELSAYIKGWSGQTATHTLMIGSAQLSIEQLKTQYPVELSAYVDY